MVVSQKLSDEEIARNLQAKLDGKSNFVIERIDDSDFIIPSKTARRLAPGLQDQSGFETSNDFTLEMRILSLNRGYSGQVNPNTDVSQKKDVVG